MEKLDGIQSELLGIESRGQNNEDKRPKEISKLPQLPPVLLQKIASMLNDGGARLQFRDSIRFASVNRQMNTAVLGSIGKMHRRRLAITVAGTYDAINVNDLTVKNQHRAGYTPTVCINALMAFSRPNEIHIGFGCVLPNHHPLVQDFMGIAERMLAAISPSTILRFTLAVKVAKFDETSPFYRMMTSIGQMVNLETLMICCDLQGRYSSPSVPPGRPFLQLLKLEKLRTYHLWAVPLTTAAQRADLTNRLPSNISHICCHVNDLNDLMPSLNNRVRAKITKICCDRSVGYHEFFDLLPSLLERLPQCTDVAINLSVMPDRWKVDEIGGRFVSALALALNKKLTVRLGVFPAAFKFCRSAGGQTAFTYEHKSIIIKILLESRVVYVCPFV